MEVTINAIAMIKLTFPQKDSYSLRLPAQQQAPITHKGGQNLNSIYQIIVQNRMIYFHLPSK